MWGFVLPHLDMPGFVYTHVITYLFRIKMNGEWVVKGSRREEKGENRKEEKLLVCKINIKKTNDKS